jgi:hypothetical protein
MYKTGLWIRIQFWIQGFDDQKLKKIKAEIFFYCYDEKLQFTTGEVFSSRKRTSSNSKHAISSPFFCLSFLPSWIRIRIQQLKLMRIHADPDPQPWYKI